MLKRLDDRVAVCLDTGHTTLGGFWDQFLAVSDGRVVHVHASDNTEPTMTTYRQATAGWTGVISQRRSRAQTSTAGSCWT